MRTHIILLSVVFALAGCDAGTTLCTTQACADHPCTAQCLFENPSMGRCPSALPATVSAADTKACTGFCGFYAFADAAPTSGGYCWHYDRTLPGSCQAPICGWNVACEVHIAPFDANQAVICPATEQCYRGEVVEDAGAYCPDLAPEPDLSAVDLAEHD